MNSSKYGDLIREARKQENQEDRKPDNQQQSADISQASTQPTPQVSVKPDNQINGQPESQLTIKSDSQKAGKEANQSSERQPEPEVNLCVKVPKSWRQHWAAEAKRKDTTMTAVIVEALKAKFGMPE